MQNVLLQESTGSLRGLRLVRHVRQLSIDQLENEGRRVITMMGAESAVKASADGRTPIFERHSMHPGSIHKVQRERKHFRGLGAGIVDP